MKRSLLLLTMVFMLNSCASMMPPSRDIISIRKVSVSDEYEVDEDWAIGDEYYSDRNYTIFWSPAHLLETTMIKTSNEAKDDTSDIVLLMDRPTTMYVAYDYNRAFNLPKWLQGWNNTGEDIEVTDEGASELRLLTRNFTHGEAVLGGNYSYPAIPGGSMYTIFYKEMDFANIAIGDTLIITCLLPPVADAVAGYNVYMPSLLEYPDYVPPVLSTTDFEVADFDGVDRNAIMYIVEEAAGEYYLFLTAFDAADNESGYSSDVIPVNIPAGDIRAPSAPKSIMILLYSMNWKVQDGTVVGQN